MQRICKVHTLWLYVVTEDSTK